MSLAGSVLQIVEAAAARDSFRRVRRVDLIVPALAGVEVSALRFALDAIAPRTVLAEADIVIDEPPSAARCLDCEADIAVRTHEEPCPRCGGFRWRPARDAGVRVSELLVD